MDSKEYFASAAPRWDQMRQSFFHDSLRDKLIAAAVVSPGMTAVDIGAGTGFITGGLIALGVNVIAVDQSPEMLNVLRSKFPAADVRLGEAESLPIESGCADAVLANMYLHHVERPEKAIAEMARILKLGGRLAISDLDAHQHEFLIREHHDRWMGFERHNVTRWLTAAGLHDAAVDCANEDCRAESGSADGRVNISIFIARGIK